MSRCFKLSPFLLLVTMAGLIALVAVPLHAERPDATAFSPIAAPFVRFGVLPIDSGAELLTLFFTDHPGTDNHVEREVPLISVLRDTLGSSDPQVHRLRYVWVHTNTSPGLKQRVAAAIAFAYGRIGNAGMPKGGHSSPVMDLSKPEDRLWRSIWEFAL